MADAGAVIQILNRNTGLPRPLQLWKATITLDAATGTFTSPEDLSGTIVEAWIDPTTLTASATVKVYDANDTLATPRYAVDYTAPNPAVENRSLVSTRYLVCGTLTCVVAGATAGDSFDLYVWVTEADISTATVTLEGTNVDLDMEPADLGVHAEDVAHVSGDTGVQMLAVRKDTAAAFAADGDYVPLQTTSSGSVRVAVVEEQCTYYAEDDAIDENSVGPTVMLKRQDTLSDSEVSTDGDGVALRGTAKGQAHVFCDGAVTAAGAVAHDAADAGNPVKVGAKAIAAAPTAVAANDRSDLYCDLYGQLRVVDAHINAWSAYEDETGAATDDELVAAPGEGLCLYITDIMVTNDATAAVTIKFEEDTGSAKTQKTGVIKVPASGGFVLNLRTPIKCTANKNFGYTSTGTSNYSVFVSGYTAA